MFTQNKNFMDSVRQATETNLKLQQDLLLGWTRFGRDSQAGRSARKRVTTGCKPVVRGVLRIAEAQREFIGQQYDAALAVDGCRQAMGNDGSTANDNAVVAPKPVRPASAASRGQPAAPKAEAAEVKAAPPAPDLNVQATSPVGTYKNIQQKVAVITGAASGIGEAVSRELAIRGAKAVMLVDRSEAVQDLAKSINESMGRTVAEAKIGDTTDEAFRKRVFNEAPENYGMVSICVPAAGITRDSLCRSDEQGNRQSRNLSDRDVPPGDRGQLIAPIYWGIEMVARIAEDRNNADSSVGNPKKRFREWWSSWDRFRRKATKAKSLMPSPKRDWRVRLRR